MNNETKTDMNWQSRSELLLGEERMQRLREAHVLLIGLGGVGGYTAEMLARSGVGRLTIVDMDRVNETNINRQLIALHSTVGQDKVNVWRTRLLDINPMLRLTCYHLFVRDEETDQLLDATKYDYVVDAIDTLSPKVHLIKSLVERELPFISIMGMGAKFNPRKIRIDRMDRAKNCPLARFIRKRLRKLHVPLRFQVIYSEELSDDGALMLTEGEQNKKSVTGTIAHNPAVAGCYAAYAAIDWITRSGTLYNVENEA